MLNSYNLRWLWLAALIIILDQTSKYFVVQYLEHADSYTLLPVLNLVLSYNPGAAFSFLGNASGWQRWFFVAVSIGVCSALVYWLCSLPRKSFWTALAISLVIGGALGNLWDRLSQGVVTDFIDFHIKNWHFATFNVADSAISIGAILLLILYLCKEEQ